MFGLRKGIRHEKNGKGTNRKKAKACHIIDLTKAPYMQYGAGIVKGNPKRCLHCGQLIRKDEAWRTYTSAEDPEYGRYTVILHRLCPSKDN